MGWLTMGQLGALAGQLQRCDLGDRICEAGNASQSACGETFGGDPESEACKAAQAEYLRLRFGARPPTETELALRERCAAQGGRWVVERHFNGGGECVLPPSPAPRPPLAVPPLSLALNDEPPSLFDLMMKKHMEELQAGKVPTPPPPAPREPKPLPPPLVVTVTPPTPPPALAVPVTPLPPLEPRVPPSRPERMDTKGVFALLGVALLAGAVGAWIAGGRR